jgi:two-component system cell cycle sensor histidine kinase/response regulator CckA
MPGDLLRVLLVEHGAPAVADIVLGSPHTQADLDVVTATGRRAALERLAAESFDAALQSLQGGSPARGFQTLVLVRERFPLLPVVAVVADGDDARGEEAIRRGADDYLQRRDLGTPNLSRTLRTAVQRAAAARLRFTDLGERRLHRITEGIPGAVFQYHRHPDGSEAFSFVSSGIRALTGLEPAEVEADAARLWSLVLGEDLAVVHESLQTSARTQQPWLAEFRLRSHEGGLIRVRGSAMPGVQPDGTTLWHGLLVDMSEHRRLEEQLRQAQKMDAVGQLAGGMAHDFNNLLTAIGSSADMAVEQLDDPAVLREHLLEIQRATARAADLTRQLLAFSRRQVLHLESVDLAEVLIEGERMLRRLIGESIALETRMAPDVPPVRADRSQLAHVVMNLAVNARDAMPEGGTLTLATGYRTVSTAEARRTRGLSAGAYSLLIVGDTGVGMDDAVRSRIFEPFFTTKEPGKGTGLGLSMVYGIVKQTGGYVLVDSAPGSGSTFTIHLPVAATPVREAKRDTPRRPPPRGTETVLVAEDEEGVRGPVRRILAAHGYRVLEAPDGPAALAVAAGHDGKIDLLLTDVVMPGMSGGELARRLRRQRCGLRVMFMSGYSTEAVATHGVLSPGAVFLQKPFTVEELVGQLRDVLDREES